MGCLADHYMSEKNITILSIIEGFSMKNIKKQVLVALFTISACAPMASQAFTSSLTSFFAATATKFQNICDTVTKANILNTGTKYYNNALNTLEKVLAPSRFALFNMGKKVGAQPLPEEYKKCLGCRENCEARNLVNNLVAINATTEKTFQALDQINNTKNRLKLLNLQSKQFGATKNVFDELVKIEKKTDKVVEEPKKE